MKKCYSGFLGTLGGAVPFDLYFTIDEKMKMDEYMPLSREVKIFYSIQISYSFAL